MDVRGAEKFFLAPSGPGYGEPMLSEEMIAVIKQSATEYWTTEVNARYFIDLAIGKEIGHKLADLVDEKTSALLTLNHLTKHEHGKTGPRARSMGDVWLAENGIYHPVNVKLGIVGREGQPNMVSIKKLLSALINRQIDSYYLLMVKMEIAIPIVPTIYFLDMLDYLEYVTFDSGPGQIMLKAKPFFRRYDPDTRMLRKNTREKVESLMALMEDGEHRLRANRERDLLVYRKNAEAYLMSGNFDVTPTTQSGLDLQ